MPQTPPDTELRAQMERYCRERDETAFRAFYDSCKHAVLRIAVHLSGRGEHAYDLSQEIWVKLWKHLCSFRGESKLMSWVYRVAMTTYLDKKNALVQNGGSGANADSARSAVQVEIARLENTSNDAASETSALGAHFAPPEKHNPEHGAETASAQALVELALARLTPAERTVFVAKHFHDLTFKEIAHELGSHEGTAKTLHFRALKKLQNILQAHYPELRGEGNRTDTMPSKAQQSSLGGGVA